MAEHESADEAAADDYEWDPAYAARAIAELREQLAAANERAQSAEAEAVRNRRLNHDLALSAMLLLKRTTAERDKARARLAELGDREVVWLTQDDEGNVGVWLDPDHAREQIISDRFAETRGAYEWVNDVDRTSELLLRDDETTGLKLWMAIVADADAAAAAHSATQTDELQFDTPTPGTKLEGAQRGAQEPRDGAR